MEVQEAYQWMKDQGFLDVTAEQNAEHGSAYAYVFFHPTEGAFGLRCSSHQEGDILGVVRFLKTQIALGRMESCGVQETMESGTGDEVREEGVVLEVSVALDNIEVEKVSHNIAELRAYLDQGIESGEGVDLYRAVGMLKQCHCETAEDSTVFTSCVVTILALL